jgi:ATP-dependent DNA helicase RecG
MAGPGFPGQERFPEFSKAMQALHHPPDLKAVEGDTIARRRVAYDELLASQIALALVRRQQKKAAGRATAGDGALRRRIEAALPFTLTDGQRQALTDIHDDMEKPERMLRLLQGDVGSGKTVVALLAMAAAAEAGRQSVLMAPTEILARQHAERLAPLAEAAGLKLALLTGREKGPAAPACWRGWRMARSPSRSAPMRCSRRASPSTISRSPSSTSSTVSACISACCSAPRARPSMFW